MPFIASFNRASVHRDMWTHFRSHYPVCTISQNRATYRSISVLSPKQLSVTSSPNNKQGQDNASWKPKIREQWGVPHRNPCLLQDTQPHLSRFEFLIDSFKRYVVSLNSSTQLNGRFCLITAWLVSDNVIIDLFNRCESGALELEFVFE